MVFAEKKRGENTTYALPQRLTAMRVIANKNTMVFSKKFSFARRSFGEVKRVNSIGLSDQNM